MKRPNCLVDLHLHLDGALSLKSVKELAAIQGIHLPENDEEILHRIRVSKDCQSLNVFLEKFAFPCSLLQTEIGIKTAMQNLLKELKEQGLMYAEIRFAPQKSTENGLTQEQVVKAALEGMKNAPIMSHLILCCMRGADNEQENRETIKVAAKYLGKGVCAVDLAGAEALFPTSGFFDVFAFAKEKNIPFTIHAGEADGPESIKTAIAFGASRIGHGIRSVEDMETMKEISRKFIPLELCPTSNLCTAVYKDLNTYPIRKFQGMGIHMTINTDDPSIEGITLWDEYEKLIDLFHLTNAEVTRLIKNAVHASFATAEEKREMFQRIAEEMKK